MKSRIRRENPRPVPVDRKRIAEIANALTDKILASLKSPDYEDDPYPSGVLALLEDVDLPVVPTAGPREFESKWSPPASRKTPKRRMPYSTVQVDIWAIAGSNERTSPKLTGHFSASAPGDYPQGYMPFALDVTVKLPGRVEKDLWIKNSHVLRSEVNRVLLHEATHFARAPWMKRSKSPTFSVLDTKEKLCAYYNDPEEVEARAQEIADQCINNARRMRRFIHPSMQGLLRFSDTYNKIAWCLTDKNNRIIVQKVYRALAEEGLAPETGKESQIVRKNNPTYEQRLRKMYGTTDDPMLGGFLLPDGSFLDFSEGSGQRIQDHRNITWASTVKEKPHESRYDVMSRVAKKVGMYRWMPENWSIEAWTMPTSAQLDRIESLAYDSPNGIIAIEAYDKNRHFHKEYEAWQAEDIVADLKAFFAGRAKRRQFYRDNPAPNRLYRDNPPWADKILVKNKALIERVAKESDLPIPGRYGEVKSFEELGCGHYGCVYPTEVATKVVFKLSSDPSEVRFVEAAIKIGDWPEGIVRYYKVIKLEGTFRNRDVFGIWREGASEVGLPSPISPKTNDEQMQRRASWLLSLYKQAASAVRLYSQKNPQKVRTMKLGEPPELDESMLTRRKLGYGLGVADITKMLGNRSGIDRVRFGIHACKYIAEIMVNEEITYHIGEAFLFYMGKGILLADVHNNNVGQVKRQENYNEPIWVITDPGHAVSIPPVWSYVSDARQESVLANPVGVEDDEGWFWITPDGKDVELDDSGHAEWVEENVVGIDLEGSLAVEEYQRMGAIRVAGFNNFQVWELSDIVLRRIQDHVLRVWSTTMLKSKGRMAVVYIAVAGGNYIQTTVQDLLAAKNMKQLLREQRRRNPTHGDSFESEALRVALAMAKVRKFKPSIKTPEAKQIVSAYYEAKGWRPDRYGNLLHPTKNDERIHFSKQRVQKQSKIMGTWKNIRTYSPVEAARNIVIEAAKSEGDTETLQTWTKGKVAKVQQKVKSAQRRAKESLRKNAATVAMKQIAAENPRLVAVAGYGILLEKEDLDRLIGRRDELVEQFMRTLDEGGELPQDGDLVSVDKPPTAVFGYDVSYLWVETVDGVEYTVHVKHSAKGNATVTIGSSSDFGLVVDPRTHMMKPADYQTKGDAQISGQVMFNGDTFMGSLFLIIAKEKGKGAGARVLSLWCRMMAGYGIEAWRAQAVGSEGVGFLTAMQTKGEIEILGGKGSDLIVQCLSGGIKNNPNDPNIGATWESIDGKKQVVGKAQGRYLVQIEGRPMKLLVPEAELTSEISFDERQLQSRRRMQAAVQSKAEAMAQEMDTRGFTDSMKPHVAGRAAKTLHTSVLSGGRVTTRKQLIESRIKAGWTVQLVRGERIFESPDGKKFLSQKDITKTGMQYADYLSRLDK